MLDRDQPNSADGQMNDQKMPTSDGHVVHAQDEPDEPVFDDGGEGPV